MGSAGASPYRIVKQRRSIEIVVAPGRKHPAAGVHFNLGKPTFVLLTVCTRNRQPWLACDEAQDLLRKIWLAADKWLVGNYVLMPDHLHCLVAPRAVDFPFDRWVTYWKSQFTKSHEHVDWHWQSDEFQHRLRDGENYSEKWASVRNNPVRHGLVKNVDEWKYQGMIHDLRWS
jgi:putative transposase